MPRLQARLSDNQLLAIASMVYASALAVVALVPNAAVVTLALIPAGTAWMAVLANVNAIVQMFLPRWVRARGLGAYQLVFFGGQAIGALAWGLVAERIGLVNTFLAAAVLTALCAATLARWPLIETRHLDREPAVFWPEPDLTVDPDPEAGPVVITATYTVAPENEAEFLDAMRSVRHTRMRTGAIQWGIFRHGETERPAGRDVRRTDLGRAPAPAHRPADRHRPGHRAAGPGAGRGSARDRPPAANRQHRLIPVSRRTVRTASGFGFGSPSSLRLRLRLRLRRRMYPPRTSRT